jgi:meiotic recombination protein SPO11
MAKKKKKKTSRKKEIVQATLGDLVSEDKKKSTKTTAKKKTKKSTPKKRAKKPAPKKSTKKPTKKKPTKKPAKKTKKKPVKKKPEPAPLVETSGPSLTSLPGVGQKLRVRLLAKKYDSIERISRSRPASMSKKVEGLSLAGAKKLIKAAKDQLKEKPAPEPVEKEVKDIEAPEPSPEADVRLTDLPGVGAKLARELERAGYNSVARLSRSRPSSVASVVDGLSRRKAESVVDAAIKMIREIEMRRFEESTAVKPKPKDVPKKEEPKIDAEVPSPTEEAKKPETKVKPPKKKKAKKPKKTKKKTPKKELKPLERKRAKPKIKKSGLPVPEAVSKMQKEMKKKWRAAEKRMAAIEAGEIPEEELVTLAETVEVLSLASEDTLGLLSEVALDVLNEAMTTGRPAFEIPSRSGDNIVWDEIRDLLLLGTKTVSRPYHSLASVVDATRTARVMEIIFQLLKSNLHATKREIYYSDVNLFREQKRSDKIIEDVASMLHTTRDSVHVVASARGSAMGRVVIRDGGDLIDLTKMGTGGWAITPFLDQVEIVESDAEFIIMSEKDAAVMRLAEAKYWNRQPCIVLTGKGSGDIATRAFLRMLVKELEIPAFALVDSDPYGHYIYSVFLRGSKRLSYESPFIATPELKLLGVLSRDLDEYNIPKAVRIPMEPTDIKRVRDMLKEPFVRSNKEWVQDLKLMLKLREKAEIQAFASHSFQYLTDEYLPRKLETGDWI